MPTISQFFNLLDASQAWASTAMQSAAFQKIQKSLPPAIQSLALPPSFCELLIRELPHALDVEMSSVLLGAWRKRNEILEYRDQRKYPAGESHAVPLLEHTVVSKHKPTIKAVIEKKPSKLEWDLQFEVQLQLMLQGVILKIQDTRIMEIRVGSCRGCGSIGYMGLTLLERQTGPYEFPCSIDLGEGILI